MKHFLYFCIAALFAASSCSKDDKTEESQSKVVEIGGVKYDVVKIGDQTWTVLNYNGEGGVNFHNDTKNYSSVGKFYTYNEAKAIALPTGWRVPSKEDYEKLLLFLGGTRDATGEVKVDASIAKKLVPTQWAYAYGNNSSGFQAFPYGFYNSTSKAFEGEEYSCAFWTTTAVSESNGMFCYGFGISNPEENGFRVLDAYLDFYRPLDRLSVRFVKDN